MNIDIKFNSKNSSDRQKIAQISTDIEILKKLSKDRHPYVRFFTASNANTPIEILIKLSKDSYYYVRDAVAQNPNTSNEILKELLNDEYCKEPALNTLIKKKGMQLLL